MIARWFWREWRSPSLLIVWLALSGGGLCTGAGQYQRSHGKGLSQQSREFMAGTGRCKVRALCRKRGLTRRDSVV